MNYSLVIKSFTNSEYRHVVSTRDTRKALDRIDDGVNINLNHAEFFTEIEEVE